MKGILIDAKGKQVKLVDYETVDDINKLIGSRCFTTGTNFPGEETMYVDDEGLMNGTEDFFMFAGSHQPFAGNGLIVGKENLDAEGDLISTSDPTMDTAWVLAQLTFMSRTKLQELYATGECKEAH